MKGVFMQKAPGKTTGDGLRAKSSFPLNLILEKM